MTAEAVVWVDVEGAIRAWARAEGLADKRVFFKADDATAPQIVIHRLGGPDDDCLIQFDCWAANKAAAVQLANELATAVDALTRYVHDDVVLIAAAVESSRWAPDLESGASRYIVDATFVASAASATGS